MHALVEPGSDVCDWELRIAAAMPNVQSALGNGQMPIKLKGLFK